MGGAVRHTFFGADIYRAAGEVDEFAVYDYPMSAGEVRARALRAARGGGMGVRVEAPGWDG